MTVEENINRFTNDVKMGRFKSPFKYYQGEASQPNESRNHYKVRRRFQHETIDFYRKGRFIKETRRANGSVIALED